MWLSLGVAAGFVYWPVGRKLVADWWTDPDASHGLVVVPVAVLFAWTRRQELLQAPRAPKLVGLVGVVAAMGLLVVGTLGAELFLTRISFLFLVAGSLVHLYGWRHVRLLAFPLVLLLLSIPIPAILVTHVTLPLQFAASRTAEAAVAAAGIPVLREGNVLMLSNATLQVAEACSGIRSLVSLAAVAVIFARFADRRWPARLAIVLSSVPVAVAVNGLRVAVTSVATYYYGPGVAEGFVHESLGWLTFLLAFAMVAIVARAVASVGSQSRPHVLQVAR
jgi:exosortase